LYTQKYKSEEPPQNGSALLRPGRDKKQGTRSKHAHLDRLTDGKTKNIDKMSDAGCVLPHAKLGKHVVAVGKTA